MADIFDQVSTGSGDIFDRVAATPMSREDMQKQFASRQGTPETAAKYGVNSGLPKDTVPQWGKEHPNLYGVYGAAKGLAAAGIEGTGVALGGASGAAFGAPAGPVGIGAGTIAGTGLGYAAGKKMASDIGLSDEPVGSPVKNFVVGAAIGAVPGVAGAAAKGIRMIPGGDTAMNLLTKAPVGRGMLDAARVPDVAKITNQMDTSFTKAVRPGTAGNRTATQASDYADNARIAAKEIVLNKDGLGLTNFDGEPVEHLPKTLTQFRQAIDSTKRNIWKQVEDINTAAGTAGAEVPTASAVNELKALANNPVYKTMSPGTVKYAEQKAALLAKQGSFTVDQAQDAVTLANQSADIFHKNPTLDTASNAYVDALVANHLRSGLDTAIVDATGTPAAAPLRKAYGALKSIEKDVNQRAVVDARKNARGLIDFSDIYTAGELMQSIATMNPAMAAKTGTMATVKAFIKRANDPNTHVERFFKLADKLVSKSDNPYYPGMVGPVQPPPVPQPPWAGKVNTGDLAPPSKAILLDGTTNSGDIVQPSPRQQLMGPVIPADKNDPAWKQLMDHNMNPIKKGLR